jgi:hypothetical protein
MWLYSVHTYLYALFSADIVLRYSICRINRYVAALFILKIFISVLTQIISHCVEVKIFPAVHHAGSSYPAARVWTSTEAAMRIGIE